MNLVIDIGNSRTKAAIFSNGALVDTFIWERITVGILADIKTQFTKIEHVILSSVIQIDSDVIHSIATLSPHFLQLTHTTPLPLKNGYRTPETLGLDRLAAAAGAQGFFPGKDLLVIDAGTAITYDLVEGNGQFLGGNISPGLKSRFRALHEFTNQLPLLDETIEPPEIGQSTHNAIRAGVVHGMTFEIDGTIDSFRQKYPGLQIVLTGGDAHFFERRLKNPIFVKSEITLIGLNRILEYNVEKQ